MNRIHIEIETLINVHITRIEIETLKNPQEYSY